MNREINGMNILHNIRNNLMQDDVIASSVHDVFINDFPEKMARCFIALELIDFKANITKNCTAGIKLSVYNPGFSRNLPALLGKIENTLQKQEQSLTVGDLIAGHFIVRDLFRKISNKQVSFSINLSIKLFN